MVGNANVCRLALVDGDVAIHESVRAHLAATEPGWRLDAYHTSTGALKGMASSPPNIVLLEQTLPDGCGFQCARQLKTRCPELSVVIHAAQGCSEKLLQALAVGAMGYVVKNDGVAMAELVPHLRKAMERRFTMCAYAERLLPQTFAGFGQGNPWGLTHKQREVMLWLCQNKSEKEISTIMGLAIATVHTHLIHSFKKLGVHNRKAAVEKYLPIIIRTILLSGLT